MSKYERTVPVVGVIAGEDKHQSKRLTLRFCTLRGGDLRGLGSDDPLDDLVISAYVGHEGYGDGNGKRPNNEVWGMDVALEEQSFIRVDRLELVAKTIRSIQKKLDKMHELEGTAVGFGQYVNRWLRAVGAVEVYRRKKDRSLSNSSAVRDAAYVVDLCRREMFPTEQEIADARAQAA